MSLGINVIGGKTTADKFASGDGFRNLQDELSDLGDFLINYMSTKKLRGGGNLGSKGQGEGRLRRSLNKDIRASGGKNLRLIVGTPFSFYIVHETGKVIQGKPLMIFSPKRSRGRLVFASRVVIPKRPFLKPTLMDNRDLIRRRLGKAFVSTFG